MSSAHSSAAALLSSHSYSHPPARWQRGRSIMRRVPRGLFFLFLFSLPFETFSFGLDIQSFSLAKLTGFLLFGAALARPEACLRQTPKGFWLFGVYLVIFACLGISQAPEYQAATLMRFLQVLQMLVMFRICYNIMLDRRMLDGAIITIVGAALSVAILQLLGIGVMVDLDDLGPRYSMFAENVNTFAATMSLGSMAALSIAYERKDLPRNIRLIALAAVGLLAFAVTRTASRGASSALLLTIPCFLLRKEFFERKLATLLVLILCIGGLLMILLQFDTSRARWENSFDTKSSSGRDVIFEAALDLFLQRPLLGWGPSANIAELGARFNSLGRDTHNLYLWILTETGVVGATPYFLALLILTKSAWRARRGSQRLLPFAMMVFLALYNTTDTWFNRKLFWVVLAYACASEQDARLPAVRRRGLLEARTLSRLPYQSGVSINSDRN